MKHRDDSRELPADGRVQQEDAFDGGGRPLSGASGSHEPRRGDEPEESESDSFRLWSEEARRRVATLFRLLDQIDRDRPKPAEKTEERKAA